MIHIVEFQCLIIIVVPCLVVSYIVGVDSGLVSDERELHDTDLEIVASLHSNENSEHINVLNAASFVPCGWRLCKENEECKMEDDFYGECVCKPNFEWDGESCKVPDPCATKPCRNGGTCQWTKGSTDYKCVCLAIYTGSNCETIVDPCDPNPCKNEGLCEARGNLEDVICYCLTGFTGMKCEREADPCRSHPCYYGSNCKKIDNHDFTCACASNATGNRCEKEFDPCASNPCQNGGTCSKRVDGSYNCLCPSNITGANCETGTDLTCYSKPCQNGGTCEEDNENGLKCSCTKWYTGTYCTEDKWCVEGSGKQLCPKGACAFDHQNEIGYCKWREKTERRMSAGVS